VPPKLGISVMGLRKEFLGAQCFLLHQGTQTWPHRLCWPWLLTEGHVGWVFPLSSKFLFPFPYSVLLE
jgi:hypothetical protein